jgi:DNA-binding transcriptional ArsR family regulator/uncharacterized protein YndB with AHSA1/START domain
VDPVWKALADPTRRALLDALDTEDGQTLTSLEHRFEISRIGVLKHLRVLEAAGLVTTRRRGREKLHYLNTGPLRQAHDKWLRRYTAESPAVAGLTRRLEQAIPKVFEIYIRTSADELWRAITDSSVRGKFHFGNSISSDWTDGSHYVIVSPRTPGTLVEGINLRVEPPRRLVQTYRPLWSPDVQREATSRVSWEIAPVADTCRLTVVHDHLSVNANPEIYSEWPMILSGLKTWLELGQVLTTPGSLMHGP